MRSSIYTVVAAGVLSLVLADGAAGQATSATPQDARLMAELGLQESERPVRESLAGWKKPRKIVVRVDEPGRIAWLQDAAPGVKLVAVSREDSRSEKVLPLLADADALVGVIGGCNEQMAKAGKNLRWIHADSAGVEHCAPYLRDREGVALTNMQRVFGLEISDHIIALMFGLSRGLDGIIKSQGQEKWVLYGDRKSVV